MKEVEPPRTRMLRAAIIAFAVVALFIGFSLPGLSSQLIAIATNTTIVMTAIGLYPLLVLVQVHRKRLRFELPDLCATILSFGWTLVPLDYLLQKVGYPLREYPAFFLYVEIMLGIGFLSALRSRNALNERAVALRWLIFVATLTAPATVVPALLGVLGIVQGLELFHNDWCALLSWVALVAPVLISTWFIVIREFALHETKEQSNE